MNLVARLMFSCCVYFCGSNTYAFSFSELNTTSNVDSTKTPKTNFFKKNIKSAGNISLGYDYGAIPFIVQGNYPTGYFRTDGNFTVDLLKLPFEGGFYYSTIRNISGLNNYFRVTFDVQSYKDRLLQKVSDKKSELLNQKEALNGKIQKLQQRLLYLEHMGNQFTFPDSLKNISPELINDTLMSLQPGMNFPEVPTDFDFNNPVDVSDYTSAIRNSYTSEVETYKTKLSELLDLRKKIEQKIISYSNPETMLLSYKENLTPFEKFTSGIKRFEIGMCYPDYSPFLVSNLAMRGINLEYTNQRFYFGITHGRTVNNILFSNNVIQNQLNSFQNMFNFFDFGNVQSGRQITAINGGIGKKEGSHLFVGFLYGLGQQNYSGSDSLSMTSPALERNYVASIDGKLAFNKYHSVDVHYGRSSLQLSEVDDVNNGGWQNIFNASDRTHAAQLKYNAEFPKTKTKFSLSGRLIDPFFKSYGVGFIRSDNFRAEARFYQNIGKKLKLSGYFRRDEDNLLSLMQYKNVLTTIGVQLGWKISKRWNARVSYNPVLQNVSDSEGIGSFQNSNRIINGIVSWNKNSKKIQMNLNGMMSYYEIFDGTTNNIFQNASMTYVITKKSFSNQLSAQYFYTSMTDSLIGNTTLLYDELSFKIKDKITLSGGFRYANSKVYGDQIGGLLRLNWKLNKNFSWENSIDKVVIGDFYNNYTYDQIREFPYYCYTKLIIHW